MSLMNNKMRDSGLQNDIYQKQPRSIEINQVINGSNSTFYMEHPVICAYKFILSTDMWSSIAESAMLLSFKVRNFRKIIFSTESYNLKMQPVEP